MLVPVPTEDELVATMDAAVTAPLSVLAPVTERVPLTAALFANVARPVLSIVRRVVSVPAAVPVLPAGEVWNRSEPPVPVPVLRPAAMDRFAPLMFVAVPARASGPLSS